MKKDKNWDVDKLFPIVYNKCILCPIVKLRHAIMFFYVYVLESLKNRELYVGYSDNLKVRLEKHNRGAVLSTKRYMPWKLIYYEACLNREDAQRREKYFKNSQGRRLMKRRLKEYFYLLKQ